MSFFRRLLRGKGESKDRIVAAAPPVSTVLSSNVAHQPAGVSQSTAIALQSADASQSSTAASRTGESPRSPAAAAAEPADVLQSSTNAPSAGGLQSPVTPSHANASHPTSQSPAVEEFHAQANIAHVHNESPSTTSAAAERSEKYGLLPLTGNVDDATLDSRSPDVVAIHGIDGDAYKTWTHDNGSLWLRDFLPQQLQGARVFTFGYPSEVVYTRAKGNIVSFGRSLLEQLKAYRVGEVCPAGTPQTTIRLL
jgi:hypothetical protein